MRAKHSQQFRDLINGLLTVDPTKRFRMADVLSHSWMIEMKNRKSVITRQGTHKKQS